MSQVDVRDRDRTVRESLGEAHAVLQNDETARGRRRLSVRRTDNILSVSVIVRHKELAILSIDHIRNCLRIRAASRAFKPYLTRIGVLSGDPANAAPIRSKGGKLPKAASSRFLNSHFPILGNFNRKDPYYASGRARPFLVSESLRNLGDFTSEFKAVPKPGIISLH
jgi:hypothetical protein